MKFLSENANAIVDKEMIKDLKSVDDYREMEDHCEKVLKLLLIFFSRSVISLFHYYDRLNHGKLSMAVRKEMREEVRLLYFRNRMVRKLIQPMRMIYKKPLVVRGKLQFF